MSGDMRYSQKVSQREPPTTRPTSGKQYYKYQLSIVLRRNRLALSLSTFSESAMHIVSGA